MLKEFRILQTCSICGQGFDSDYKLAKHVGATHTRAEKPGRVGGSDDSCSCGGQHTHPHDDG
ncbi:MAG: hypothetical protein ACREA4_12535 [Nitrososphaera sp.]